MMEYKNFKAVEYTPDKKAEWDTFVDASTNGTVFHKQAFLDYHPAGRFNFHHVMIYKDDALVSVIPGGITGEMFKSPTGSSFGGFVVEREIGIEDADNIVKVFIKYCSEKGIKEIYITPPMQVYYDTWNEAVEFSMHYNHFIQISALYSSAIDFSKIHSKDDLSQNTRHKINAAINKGVQIVEKNDFDTFYPILLKNKAKFDAKPTHTLEELKRIEQLVPGTITLFLAYFKDEPIAGQLLFHANKNCMLNFYTMHLYEHRNLYSVNLLIEHAIRWCNQKGYKYYDYGVSADTFNIDPMEPSWSLIQFKESMGALGCQRKTYYRRVF